MLLYIQMEEGTVGYRLGRSRGYERSRGYGRSGITVAQRGYGRSTRVANYRLVLPQLEQGVLSIGGDQVLVRMVRDAQERVVRELESDR